MLDPDIEARLARLAAEHGWPAAHAYLEDLLARARASLATIAPGGATMSSTLGGPEVTPPTISSSTGAPAADDVVDGWPARYERLERIGRGGMGEVWRVRDHVLKRTLALKLIQPHLVNHATAMARFREEAQVTARLQHPGIVPVHDLGWLADGRWWYTMEEVRGRRLGDLLEDLRLGHATWSLHRLVDTFRRACEAVAFAHAQGVIHRDLKPDNILTGAHGEIRVVDWGIAKVLGAADAPDDGAEEGPRSWSPTGGHTGVGGVLGTRQYMPPEQARAERVGPWSDVYALGVILEEILRAGGGAAPPGELTELVRRATAEDPQARPQDAGMLAFELGGWLDGARAREKALAVVREAEAGLAAVPTLRATASQRRAEAALALATVRPWEPVERKRAAWQLEDEADALEREAERQELASIQRLQGAFLHSPDLPEAHAALADWYRARHAEAEASGSGRAATRAAARAEQQLRFHDRAGRHAAWLRGDGALTLHTHPAGAEVILFQYQRIDRRLVPVRVGSLGHTPLDAVPLAMGSYLLQVQAPGHLTQRYPVSIGRQVHWDGIPPGVDAPRVIPLPALDSLSPDEVYVPPGWAWTGGDPEANHPVPRRRLWFEPLVAKRFPVTNREYIVFLDDLVSQGREAEALRHAPRERAAKVEEEGALLYGRDASGRFFLQVDADGDPWDPDWPVMHVDWFGARAYAAWLAARTGQPWRLSGDLEFERLARGVDGRLFPWGDVLDPTWCHMLESHAQKPGLAVVDSYPVDESPWGVRGMGGNVRQWCLDRFHADGPPVEGARALPPVDPGEDTAVRVTRGGDWYGQARLSRSGTRGRDWPQVRVSILGFRVVRSA